MPDLGVAGTEIPVTPPEEQVFSRGKALMFEGSRRPRVVSHEIN